MEEHAAEWVALERIKPWAKNPRQNKDAIKSVADSIKRFGFGAPIVARLADGEIIAGHTRYAAAKQLGLERVPVRFLDLDPADAHLLAMADNKLGEIAEWNDRELAELLSGYSLEDAGLAGWDSDALEELGSSLLGDGPEPEDPPDLANERIDELLRKWGVKRGQVWTLGRHRLACGDCTDENDVRAAIGDKKPTVCLTDPPYGLDLIDSGKNDYRDTGDSSDVLKVLAEKWLPIARRLCPAVIFTPGIKNAWLYPHPDWIMCWMYQGGTSRSPWGFTSWQPFLCYGKDPSLATGNGGRPDAVLMSDPNSTTGIDHPAPKPMKVWHWFIERLSFSTDDVFYEPFSGSGTTLIACEQLNRTCVALELSPGYVALALERMSLMGVDVKLA